MASLSGGSARADTLQADAPPTSTLARLARERAQPSVQRLVLLLMLAAALPRLFLLPLNENLYGDAVIRTELATRWAAHPHWISSYADGAFQFGPLQLYLMGLLLQLGLAKEHVGRVLSLVVGVLSVVPLFSLTRRVMGQRAAVWACAAFAVWGMHLQFSTTAGSEALALFFGLTTLAFFAEGTAEGRFAPLVCSAISLNLACATRYDAWLFIPLLSALLLFQDKDKVAAVTRAILFALFSLPFPLLWMYGNELAEAAPGFPSASALAPIHYIDDFHRRWVADGLARWGQLGYRLQNLLFWPATAAATLSPLVGLLGMAGMAIAFRRRRHSRWLVWVAWAPALYFTVRGAVLLNFQPLARFTAAQLVLVLPFIDLGFTELLKDAGRRTRQMVAAIAIALAVAWPIALGAFTFRSEGKLQDALRPISPTSTNPQAMMRLAKFIKEELLPRNAAIILDSDPGYSDLQIAFFGGLPEERMARYRWQDCVGDGACFPDRLRAADPEYLLRIEGGKLAEEPQFQVIGSRARLGDRVFEEVPGFSPPFHVYRRP